MLGFDRLEELRARFEPLERHIRRKRKRLGFPLGVIQIPFQKNAIVGRSEPSAVLTGCFATGCGRMEGLPRHGDKRGQAVGLRPEFGQETPQMGRILLARRIRIALKDRC